MNKSRTPEYIAWSAMKQRCFNEENPRFSEYGGRGITVCPRWAVSFSNFLEDMGPRPSPDHSLDRINNDGDYEPENCRWATRDQQRQNKRPKRKGYRLSVDMRRADATAAAKAVLAGASIAEVASTFGLTRQALSLYPEVKWARSAYLVSRHEAIEASLKSAVAERAARQRPERQRKKPGRKAIDLPEENTAAARVVWVSTRGIPRSELLRLLEPTGYSLARCYREFGPRGGRTP